VGKIDGGQSTCLPFLFLGGKRSDGNGSERLEYERGKAEGKVVALGIGIEEAGMRVGLPAVRSSG